MRQFNSLYTVQCTLYSQWRQTHISRVVHEFSSYIPIRDIIVIGISWLARRKNVNSICVDPWILVCSYATFSLLLTSLVLLKFSGEPGVQSMGLDVWMSIYNVKTLLVWLCLMKIPSDESKIGQCNTVAPPGGQSWN